MTDDPRRDRLEQFTDRYPEATVAEAIGAVDGVTPADRELVEDVLDADTDRSQGDDTPAPTNTENGEKRVFEGAKPDSPDENPGGSPPETADASAGARSSRKTVDVEGAETTEPLGTTDTNSVRHTSATGNVDDTPKSDGDETAANGSTSEPRASEASAWDAAAFDSPEADVYPPALLEREQWMGRKGKLPFAPWGDRDADLECTHTTCTDHDGAAAEDVVEDCPDCQAHRDGTTTAECDHDARYKWGHAGHYVDGEHVAMAEADPRLDGRVFLQRDPDPFAFVDGDDVRDPETGEVHPGFVDVLDALGATYADVSTSGAGVHAYYQGDLPDELGQAVFDLDTEPFGANDDPPTVEIYANKHVCVATGEHVPNTPIEVREWDVDALDAVLDEYLDPEDRRPDDVDHDTDRERDDLEDYEPTATAADETTDEIRDVLAAVDRLRPVDLSLRTRQVGSDATGWEQWDPSTYRTSSGNDSLHKPAGEPVFHDHKHDESFGVLSLFAAEQGILSKPWHRLAGAEWWDAVATAREQGAPIPEYAGPDDRDDVDHTPVLPDTGDLDTASSGWDWKHAGRTDDTLTVDAARERTVDAIADAYTSSDRVLVEALPTMGKSYGAVKAAAETDEPVTILTGRGQKEQYGQLKQWADEHGLTAKVLPNFTTDCPTAAGEHGAEWKETVMDWYRRGATGQQIHNAAEYTLGRPLPCQVADDGTHIDCGYRHAWNFDPDEYDVLIGHYTHAHVDQVTKKRTVVFDEFPEDAYETTLSGDVLQTAISYWLSTVEAVPFDNYTDLIGNRDDDARRADALAWFLDDDGGALDTAEGDVFDDDTAHAAAPLAVFAVLAGDDLGNGFESAELQGAGTAAFNQESGEVSILQPPTLKYTSGVVALDGTPTKRLWELALGERLNHRAVLQEDERAEYVRDALNLNLVRTTEYVKPYNSADHVNTEQDAALLEGIAEKHGARPSAITTSTAEREYDVEGILDLVDETKHYGNVLGSNEFKETRLGAVVGSNHYGDGFIKKWGAYAGRAVERVDSSNDGKGAALSYGSFGDDVLQHMRDHDTLQAAMRFGRDGNGAVVYVHTDTLPDWVPLAGEGRVVSTWSDGMRAVLDALGDLSEATTADVVEHPAVDLSRQQAFEHLENLRERGVLQRQQDPEDGRRMVWADDGVHRVGEHGDVDLDPVDLEDLDDEAVRQLARSSNYTWEFTNFTDRGGSSTGDPSQPSTEPTRALADGPDPPPGAE